MGCDIHLAVEQRDESGQWHRMPAPECVRDDYYVEKAAQFPDDKYYQGKVKWNWYDGRNYSLFGMLANVRNGYGFAGCDTGNPVVPISEPRGLPDDMSDAVRRMTGDDCDGDEMDLGDHSYSWLLVSELLAYHWDQQSAVHRGWVDPWNYELWRRNGKPSHWCGGVSGPNIDHISATLMGDLIDKGDIVFTGEDEDWSSPTFNHRPYTTSLGRTMGQWGLPAGSVGAAMAATIDRPQHYCCVEWSEPYSKSAGKFYETVLPALAALGRPEETRIVFGFDS